MTYSLTVRAARDLEEILLFGAERFGLKQAEDYARGLAETFAFLAEYPLAARLRTELGPPAHAYLYRMHLILYDVTTERDVVIIRIRHAREDWLSDARGDGGQTGGRSAGQVSQSSPRER